MAFSSTSMLCMVSGGNSIFIYKEPAVAAATLAAAGYFNSYVDNLRLYDVIMIVSTSGVSVAYVNALVAGTSCTLKVI
jgi:hypothetical protein